MVNCIQFLWENRLNGCQIFGRFGFLKTESEPNCDFLHIPNNYISLNHEFRLKDNWHESAWIVIQHCECEISSSLLCLCNVSKAYNRRRSYRIFVVVIIWFVDDNCVVMISLYSFAIDCMTFTQCLSSLLTFCAVVNHCYSHWFVLRLVFAL